MKLSIRDNNKKDLFIAIFQLLKNCSSSIKLLFTKEELYIQGMDKSHVCLFDIKISSLWFDSYEKNDEDTDDICVIPQTFHTVLSSASNNQNIFINYIGNPESVNIELIIKDNIKGEFSNYFKIPITDTDTELLNIPEVEYDSEFMINSKKIHEITSKMMLFGDNINIICNENNISLKTVGVLGEMSVDIPIDDLAEYSICEGEIIKLTYSLNYIHKMCLTTKLSEEVEFSISQHSPMRIKYDLGENSRVLFYLAPKIED